MLSSIHDTTVHFFTTGFYEYPIKGVDMFAESLGPKLNSST